MVKEAVISSFLRYCCDERAQITKSKAHYLALEPTREFFAQIAAGTKRIEYRARKPYWRRQLEGRNYDVVQFRNGYATKAPEMQVEFLGVRKVKKWGRRFYAIRLGRILKIKRWLGATINR